MRNTYTRLIPCLLAACLVGFSFEASAIVIDINRTQAEATLPNVSTNPYSGVGSIWNCTATPVGKTVVVTAAHCINPGDERRSFFLRYDDQPNVIQYGNVFTYPGYNRSVESFDQLPIPDLAVIKLDQPLPDYVKTYSLFSGGSDLSGLPVELVGYGRSGFGDTGQTISGSSSVKRYGRNEIERLDNGGNYIVYDFDGGKVLPPCDKACELAGGNNGPGTTGLSHNSRLGSLGLGSIESTAAPGDSGGPAFYNPFIDVQLADFLDLDVLIKPVPDTQLLIGVTSFGRKYSANQPFSSFGTTAHYTYIAPFIDWIESFADDVQTTGVTDLFSLRPASTETLMPLESFNAPPPLDPDSINPPDDPMAATAKIRELGNVFVMRNGVAIAQHLVGNNDMVVESPGGASGPTGIQIASTVFGASGAGSLTIDGQTLSLENFDNTVIGPLFINVGRDATGTGSLSVINGGVLRLFAMPGQGGAIDFGQENGSFGMGLVSGADSRILTNRDVRIGEAGNTDVNAMLTIENGGLVRARNVLINNGLVKLDGGTITATNQVFLGLGGKLMGTGMINSTLFNDGGEISPGASPGDIIVTEFIHESGVLILESLGGNIDRIIATGGITIGPAAFISLIFDVLPVGPVDLSDYLVAGGVLDFTEFDGSNLTASVIAASDVGRKITVAFGDKSIDVFAQAAPVAEPNTIAVFAIGIAGLAATRRRWRPAA